MSVLLVLLENGVVEMVCGQWAERRQAGESNLGWSFPQLADECTSKKAIFPGQLGAGNCER